MPNGKHSRSAERALSILSVLAQADDSMGITELARTTGFSKSTVHLSLQTMRALGFVEQDESSGRYGLGLAAAQLGTAALDNSRLVTMLQGRMRDLADRSKEAVSLGIRVNHEVVFIKRFETSHVLRTSIREGTRMPLHASASGKALMMGMSLEEICAVFPEERLPEQATNTLLTRSDLLIEWEKTVAQGYATSNDEFVDGVSAAAVPVRVGKRVVASISIAGPTSRFRATNWIAELRELTEPGWPGMALAPATGEAS